MRVRRFFLASGKSQQRIRDSPFGWDNGASLFIIFEVPCGAVVRFYVRSFRWLLSALLILSTAAQMAAQNTKQPSTEDIARLIKQAESGDAKAQCALGVAYQDVRGVARDDAEAIRWYRKAAEQGDAKAQNNLGVAYDNGRGVSIDEAEAVRWFRKAAEQKDAGAQNNLGTMYEHGRGVAKDEAEAALWFRKAAEQGDAVAQTNLGVAYAKGGGVPKDGAGAYFWLNLGASTLDDDARSIRDEVGGKLTQKKRLLIQERCRKWEETHPPNRA